MKVVVLVGGVGGAKLVTGLAKILPPEDLTVIVNTGDDCTLYGLRVCPDIDTVLYTLAGWVDPGNGLGVAGDTALTLGALARYGEPAWFRLGDQDMATHILRTQWLHEGLRLTDAIARLANRMGIAVRVLPMSDALAPTVVDTIEHGPLEFQEYFVRYRWQPSVRSLTYGAAAVPASADVLEALQSAELLLLGPSNPWLSVEPILALPGVRAIIEGRDVPRVAVSPIVRGTAIKGPAAKLMRELGLEVSAAQVARHYGKLLNGFVYDVSDGDLNLPPLQVKALDTIMKSDDDKVRLARSVLDWIQMWGSG